MESRFRPDDMCGVSTATRTPPLRLILILPASALLFICIAGTIMAPWAFYWAAAAVAAMPKHKVHAAAVATSSSSSSGNDVAASPDLSWHAPAQTDINDLDQVMEGSGVYGFIYDSSHTPDEQYGTYNWCNMPHVRAREYVPADSAEYELRYVELVHRHHKRTPYASNAFPVEPYTWDCDDQALYNYGEPLGNDEGDQQQLEAARGYRKGFTSPINPFVPSGWIGSCQFPQITPGGLDDSWQHGADLYAVYHDLLGFLPDRDDENGAGKVQYRVTNNLITSQVAGMLVNAMWGTTDRYPLRVQAAGVDSLEPQYTCAVGSSLFSAIKSSGNPAWQEHLDRAQELYSILDDISGVSDGGSFHASFDPYYDNLSARQCHDKPLPCKLVDGANTTTCITQELADAVYRLGHWEYSQTYRDHKSSLAASSTSWGVWIAELTANLKAVIGGNTDTIYRHNVAHDGSVSRVLSILQIDEMVWPGMGAEVVFELYKKKKNGDDEQPPAPTPTVIAPGCSHNNCLRQLIRHPESADSFCPTFTTSSITARPTWPSNCDGTEQMSSACSCLYNSPGVSTSAAALESTGSPSEVGGDYFVRVLFGGQILKSSVPQFGLMDMIPVETLLGYFDGLVGEEASLVKGKCDGSIPV